MNVSADYINNSHSHNSNVRNTMNITSDPYDD